MMHKNSRLISVVRFSGKRLYGGSAAARLKTDNEDISLTTSLPSAKSWARPPQSRPSAVTRSTVSSGSESRKGLGKWTTKNEIPKSVSVSKETPSAVTRSTVSSGSESRRDFGRRTTENEVSTVNASSSSGAEPSSSRASPGANNLRKWSFPAAFDNQKGSDNRKGGSWSRTTPSDQPRHKSLPPHMTLPSNTRNSQSRPFYDSHQRDDQPRRKLLPPMTPPSNTRNSLSRPLYDSRQQNERMRLSSERRKDSSQHTAQTSTNDTSRQSSPDYSTFQVFRDHNDPRREPRRQRAVPERTNYHNNNRRGTVLNKPLIKRSVRPKKKQIFRRKDVFIPTTLTVAMLARVLKVKLAQLLNKMRRVGMDMEANYDHILSADYAALLAEEFGFNPVIDDDAAFDIYPPKAHPNPSSLPSRPPIVTIMGHVDHGKTTLLDTLRSASVAKGEAGGITQHIGAFSVPVTSQTTTSTGPQSITFLDTPGHAAFSAMRARGANITDIVVLVVAADDGIMPQTEEVINLLKKEENSVDLIVAINKIDKHDANPDGVKKALMAHGVQLEEFGGDIPAVHVSGLTGDGLPDLIETLSAVAEVRDLRADQGGAVYGHVIESNIHKGLGSVATVLIRQGCLKIGSHIISGSAQGKVRRMTDSSGKTVQSAVPGMAVTVSGWKTLPKAGDEVLDGIEGDIKKAIVNRLRREETEALQEDAEAINESRRQEREARAEAEEAGEDTPAVPVANDGPKVLKLLIKGDVSGSCEALEGALNGIGNGIAISKVIHTGVGDITESDILMAKAANGTIIGFSVSAPRSISSMAAQNEVPISTGNIIYRLIDDVRSRVIDMLPKIIETKVTGEATVLQLFDITGKSKQIIKVAGCRVVNGLVEKLKFARVIRNGGVIHEGSLDTMRQLKKEITEARKGTECGLTLKGFSDFQEGDLIQVYERIEKPGVI